MRQDKKQAYQVWKEKYISLYEKAKNYVKANELWESYLSPLSKGTNLELATAEREATKALNQLIIELEKNGTDSER